MKSQTMKSVRIQIVSLLLAGLISMPAHGEVIPGRWEKVSNLELGTPITVELKNGDRIQGQFRGLPPSHLELLSPAGWAAIPRTDIRAITLPSKDGLGEGAWKGAAVGAAVSGGYSLIALGVVGMSGNSGTSDIGEGAFQALVAAALSTGIGAAIGVAADAAKKTDDIVVYKAHQAFQ